MSRSSINLSKTSQNKLSKFERALKAYDIPSDFIERTTTMVRNDVRLLRECSEKSIVDFYIETTYAMLDKGTQIDESFYTALKNTTRSKLARKYTSNKTFDNNIDIYFNEVKREYIKCPQSESDDLEFLPENRDIFISNNLKLVIECAKRYRNLGLPFEDLIQIGNYGLLIAFEKFDTERASLRAKIMSTIRESELDAYTHDEAEALIRECFTYSKNLEKTVSAIPEDGFLTKEEFLAWVRQNVKTAVFASVAFQWIRAYIILELNRLGKIIRIPKSARDSEDISHIIINLDAINPHTDDCYHDNQISEIANEEFIIEDEYIENAEKQELFRDFVDKVLYKLSATDRRIIMSHFGIGKPYQLSVQEIAEQEGLSVNKVKYSIAASMRTIHDSVSPQQKEMILSLLS